MTDDKARRGGRVLLVYGGAGGIDVGREVPEISLTRLGKSLTGSGVSCVGQVLPTSNCGDLVRGRSGRWADVRAFVFITGVFFFLAKAGLSFMAEVAFIVTECSRFS